MEINQKIKKILNRKKRVGWSSFLIVFTLMCVLKLWFTMFLVLGFGLILTIIEKKRRYCFSICPIGTVLDFLYEPKEIKKRKLTWLKAVQPILLISFWAYLFLTLFIFWNDPFAIWSFTLRLMLFSFALAIALQYWFGKRFWCVHLCPLGYCMNQALKNRNP